MGRPPSSSSSAWSSCQSPTRPWAPPSTALSGYGGLTRGAAAAQSSGRHFVLPIPPIPAATAKAIRHALAGSSALQPFASQQNRIRGLTVKLREQWEKSKSYQQKIVELESQKEQGLRDIRETRQQETVNTVAAIERKLKSRYNKELVASRASWQEKVDKECEAKRNAWRLAREISQVKTASKVDENDDDTTEPAKKRIKLSGEPTTADSSSTGELPVVTDVVPETTVEPSLAVVPVVVVDMTSEVLKKELVETETALEKHNGTRTEMIWLLKQVIKAEEKQKDDLIKRNTTRS